MKRRVVVTGLGMVSPIGIGVKRFWEAALAGRSGITALQSLESFPSESYRSKVAGQIPQFSPDEWLPGGEGERVDRYAQFALVASREAIEDAGLSMPRAEPARVGVMVGAGMGGMMMGEREFRRLHGEKKPQRVHPHLIPVITLNSASGIVAMVHGAKGPNLTISTACSSSAHALGLAFECIRDGRADVMIVVGAEASLTPLVFAGFCALRALSTSYNDTPEKASRPFDRGRDGFVMGEGAGALILESLTHAKKRKARLYAEVAGYAATCEAYHMVIPREDGSDVAATMRLALKSAGMTPAQVDYINAHATSTSLGDTVEASAIRQLFQRRADAIAVSATKSLVGHTLGAAGAIGAVATTLSIHTGHIHPTANFETPDPACRLAGLSGSAQKRRVRAALVNAFGFGGNNACVVLKKVVTDGAR